jgi:hypothetical protein
VLLPMIVSTELLGTAARPVGSIFNPSMHR